jgi:hypothetical protein
MPEDRKAKYIEKKTVLISYRLTKSDASALMRTAPEGRMSISEVARLRMLEAMDDRDNSSLEGV